MYILFTSLKQLIKADDLCQLHQLSTRVIPVPEHLSSDCGMCMEVDFENLIPIIELLEKQAITYKTSN
jgi:hypothetical protein